MWQLALLVLAFYIALPAIVYLRRRPLGGTDRPQWTPDQPPIGVEALAFLERTQTALELAGFSPPTRLSTTSGKLIAHMWVFLHRDETTVATVATLKTRQAVVLRSYPDNGRVLLTTNQPAGRLYPDVPFVDALRFTGVTEPAVLWKIHQRRIQDLPLAHPIVDGDVAGYANRESRRLREGFIEMGYVRKVSDGTERITLRGAMLMSWRRLFPWKQFIDWRDARAAAAFLS